MTALIKHIVIALTLICLPRAGDDRSSLAAKHVIMCDLFKYPEKFSGTMVTVDVYIAGKDLYIDDFAPGPPCSSYMRVHLEMPEKVKPSPSFHADSPRSLADLRSSLDKGYRAFATITGRFDAAYFWRDHKRNRVPGGYERGFGPHDSYDGRIIVKSIDDVRLMTSPGR